VNTLLGLMGLLVLGAALVLGMRGAERLMARLLGLPSFRWFEVRVGPGWGWKRFFVRVASGLVPYALCAAMFFVANAFAGVPVMTTAVTVLPGGAAREAGMQDGDNVLAVGGVPVRTWDELRAQVRMHSAPVQIALERSGRRQELSVKPRQGLIGISPVSVMRRPGFGEAASLAIWQPLHVVRSAANAFVSLHQNTELRGPVGIVSDTGRAAHRGWFAVLTFLGLVGSYFWPFVVGVHLFDVVTGWTFRMTVTETDLPEPTARIARLRFSMYFALGCWLAFILAEAAAALELPGSLLLIGLLIPGVWALWPLLWVSARELWAPRSSLGVVLPVTLVPCAAPIMGIWVAWRLHAEERRLRTHL
jgi:hypothetical protein